MATISLVMIVKNEEAILDGTLQLVAPAVDEWIICDTGSTDGTKDVIRKYAEPIDLPFEDFVTTKNKALKMATGDYILLFDADERLLTDPANIRAWAERGAETVYSPIVEGEDPENPNMHYYRARLWKRSDSKFFEGPRVHEALNTVTGEMGDDIVVYHDHRHRTPDSYHKRTGYYIETILKYLEDHPEEPRALFYLGRSYMDYFDWPRAIDAYERRLAAQFGEFRDEDFQAAFDIGRAWIALGEPRHAMNAMNRCHAIDPRRVEARNAQAVLKYILGEVEEATAMFRELRGKKVPPDVVLFVDKRDYDFVPDDYLALCLGAMRQYEEAAAVLGELVKRYPKDKRVAFNLGWYKERLQAPMFFYLGDTPEDVYGGILEKRGVGGVETAYIQLTKHLAALGRDVYFFCNTEKMHEWEGVQYIPWQQYPDYIKLKPRVIVSSRDWSVFGTVPEARPIAWLQDSALGDMSVMNQWPVIVSSKWHSMYLTTQFGVQQGNIKVIPLGVDKSYYAEPVAKIPGRVIYSSNPGRGLIELTEMWPEISEAVPGINLAITYGWNGPRLWDASMDENEKRVRAFAADAGNVTILQRLPKQLLAKEQAQAELMLYPNNFWETFCLTAAECQIAGTPIVTGNLGALQDIVIPGHNWVVNGYPSMLTYRKGFVQKTIEAMRNTELREANSVALRQQCMALWNWADVAQSWDDTISFLAG